MRKLLLIIGALVIVAGGSALAVKLTSEKKAPDTPKTTPKPQRNWVIHLDRALATFGTTSGEASGVMGFRPGSVERMSLTVEGIDTPKGNTGPILVTLGTGAIDVKQTGEELDASFTVLLSYPLLATAGGSITGTDTVKAGKEQTAPATFSGRVSDGQWDGRLQIDASTAEGTDLQIPAVQIDVQSPAVYVTPSQAAANPAGYRVVCASVTSDKNGFKADEVTAAMTELRQIFKAADIAVLTPDEITRLNAAVAGREEAADEIKDPLRVPDKGCVSMVFAAKAKPSADLAARKATLGHDALAACPGATYGKLASHLLAHVLLGADTDDTAHTGNLLGTCTPGTQLDPDQLGALGGFTAEALPELSTGKSRPKENIVVEEIEKLLEAAPAISSASPSVSPSGSPRVTARPTRRPTPTPVRTPTPSPSGSPGPSASPTATATATATAAPTETP